MKSITRFGIVVSSLWAVAFGLLVYRGVGDASGMNLNEWGDFLAGFSAPLALLWLVIGYFQQGEELQLNTEALKAQQEELRRQVEETALLAKNASRQADAAEGLFRATALEMDREQSRLEVANAPIFVATGGSTSQDVSTHIQNIGARVLNVSMTVDDALAPWINFPDPSTWETKTNHRMDIKEYGKKVTAPFEFSISFTRADGREDTHVFEYVSTHKFIQLKK